MAIIPGLSYDAHGEGHAFIQVLDGVAKTAEYHQYDITDFALAPEKSSDHDPSQGSKTSFELHIGNSRFHESGCEVVLPNLQLSLKHVSPITWPWKWWSPGAMGPFSFVPGMECRHGVVSLHHAIHGSLQRKNESEIQLSSSTVGYIEKDWGKSFPRGWVWLQTNHLAGETEPCCLMVSAGRVPWITGAFRGFIAALYFRGEFHPFTTYNRASFDLELSKDSAHMVFSRGTSRRNAGKGKTLTITAYHAPGVDLISPLPSDGMHGRVNESLLATAEVRFSEEGKTILDTTANWLGFEIGGDAASWK